MATNSYDISVEMEMEKLDSMYKEQREFLNTFRKNVLVNDVYIKPANSKNSKDRLYVVLMITQHAIVFDVLEDGFSTNTVAMSLNENSAMFFSKLVLKGNDVSSLSNSYKLAKLHREKQEVLRKIESFKTDTMLLESKLANIANQEQDILGKS